VYYDEIKEYLQFVWGAKVVDGMEADDLLGMRQLAGHPIENLESYTTIIVSTDKDLDQIPGLHFNWVKGVLYEITPEEARQFYLVQLLSGDPVDNIPGIPGIGPKTAEKIIKKCKSGTHFSTIKDYYKKAYGDKWEEVLKEMDQLIRIKQYESDKGEWNN